MIGPQDTTQNSMFDEGKLPMWVLLYRGVNLSRGLIGSRNKSDHGQLNDKYDAYVSYMKLL